MVYTGQLQRTRWSDGITDSMDMNLPKLWEMVRDRGHGSLVCCSLWGLEESNPIWQLKNDKIRTINGELIALCGTVNEKLQEDLCKDIAKIHFIICVFCLSVALRL